MVYRVGSSDGKSQWLRLGPRGEGPKKLGAGRLPAPRFLLLTDVFLGSLPPAYSYSPSNLCTYSRLRGSDTHYYCLCGTIICGTDYMSLVTTRTCQPPYL